MGMKVQDTFKTPITTKYSPLHPFCNYPHVYVVTDGLYELHVVTEPLYVGPCHHGMARPPVVDGGDGLQKCKHNFGWES